MTTKQVSKGKEEKPPLSKGKEAKSERPKSSHLADLEASFDRDARRIRPFALLGLDTQGAVSYTHLRAHETVLDLVCRLLLEKKNTYKHYHHY